MLRGALEARTPGGALEALSLGGAQKALNWTEPAETKVSWTGPAETKVSWAGPAETKVSWAGPTLGGARVVLTLWGAWVALILGGALESWTETSRGSGADSVSSWDGAGSGADSVSSWDGAGSGADSVSSWDGAGSVSSWDGSTRAGPITRAVDAISCRSLERGGPVSRGLATGLPSAAGIILTSTVGSRGGLLKEACAVVP